MRNSVIVVGPITAAFLLIFNFKKISAGYLKEGIIVGISWFVINIVLDFPVLIPMSGMSIADCVAQIGLRYFAIPAMCVAVGTSSEFTTLRPERALKMALELQCIW